MSNPPPIRAPAQTGDVSGLKAERSAIRQKLDIIKKLKENMAVMRNFATNTPAVTAAAIKYDKENRHYSSGDPQEVERLTARLNTIESMLKSRAGRRRTKRRKTRRT